MTNTSLIICAGAILTLRDPRYALGRAGLANPLPAAHGASRRSVRLHYARLRAVAATAIAALAAASAATAQAAPHWYGNGTLIQGSALVKSEAKVGQLSFDFSPRGS